MCNKLFINVNSVSRAGVRHAFVSCGKCEDCRTSLRSQWIFRLRTELSVLSDKGWKIGFFTLTYSDRYLPTIPKPLFRSGYESVPCFSKADVRTFFRKLKKWLLEQYGCRFDRKIGEDTRLRYMCCAEYGEHTRRPHYHGIVCFPPNVDAVALHRKIKQLWYHSDRPDVLDLEPNRHGFVIPFDFNGERFSSETHKPFICDSVKAAAVYAAKYVCKDLAWTDMVNRYDLLPKAVECLEGYDFEPCIDEYGCPDVDVLHWQDFTHGHIEYKLSDYKPFHYQSKSLGLCFLDKLTDEQKLKYMLEGFAFVGESTFSQLPVYLKNKLCFTPDYVYQPDENGRMKRLVRRKATKFFRDNFEQIFTNKVTQVEDKLKDLLNPDYWKSLNAFPAVVDFVSNAEIRHVPLRDLACEYLCYFGVPYEECSIVANAYSWFRRYDDSLPIGNPTLVSKDYYYTLHYVLGNILLYHIPYAKELAIKKRDEARRLAFIRDFHLNPHRR